MAVPSTGNRIVTLTTDFGLDDAFVGVLKGVILRINPQARVVDICHNIAPRDIREGAFVLADAYSYFPPDTVHVAVVDPGVGTDRRPLAISTAKGIFVGPDNGLFTYVLADLGGVKSRESFQPRRGRSQSRLCGKLRAFHLTQPRFWLPQVSATFHGRDIFAPAAAHLSLGVPIEQLGEQITSLETFLLSKPERLDAGTVIAHVIHVDRFGNLITDARPAELPLPPVAIAVKGRVVLGLSASYAAGDGALVAVIDSSNRLEIALSNGNAAEELGVGVGEEVRIERID